MGSIKRPALLPAAPCPRRAQGEQGARERESVVAFRHPLYLSFLLLLSPLSLCRHTHTHTHTRTLRPTVHVPLAERTTSKGDGQCDGRVNRPTFFAMPPPSPSASPFLLSSRFPLPSLLHFEDARRFPFCAALSHGRARVLTETAAAHFRCEGGPCSCLSLLFRFHPDPPLLSPSTLIALPLLL